MGKLYHYCTVETLKCILQYKTLRLADIRKSNDSKEINYLFDEYKKWFLKQNNYSSEAYRQISALSVDEKIQLENTVFLVSCFSKKADDLHMWSCYANKGVCIAFDENKLKKYIDRIHYGMKNELKDMKVTSACPSLAFRKVEYYNSTSIVNYFNAKLNSNNNQYSDFFTIFKESPFIKNDFFKNEKEVRIVHTYISNPNEVNYLSLVDSKGNVEKDIKFQSASSDRYQHKMVVDIPIEPSLIKSITIGPNSTLTKQDVDELLFINGIDGVDVDISKGTYR